jgi:hypothetical protein
LFLQLLALVEHLSSSNFLAPVDAVARVFIQSGVVTVLKKGPTSAGIGDTAPSIVVLHGDCAVRASEDEASGLKTVKGNGKYRATLASEGKTPVGGKSAAGEACHKEENCGSPEHANAPESCSCILPRATNAGNRWRPASPEIASLLQNSRNSGTAAPIQPQPHTLSASQSA